jgi:hypothetical protein
MGRLSATSSYLSLYTTFESKTWQFTEMFEIEFGKNISEFL